MKRIIIVIAILLQCVALKPQQRADSINYIKYYYPNGVVSSEGYLRDGKPDGYWKTYTENGQLKSEGNRHDFELDGVWKFYDDSARLFLSISYKKGMKHGFKTTYYKGGQRLEESYVEDLKEGKSIEYDLRGAVRIETPFVKGLEDGIAKEYDAEGNVITIIEYRKGFLIGRQIINRKDKQGRRQGLWTTYYPEGNLQIEAQYRDDKLHGYYKEYARDGSLQRIRKYSEGEELTDVAELRQYDRHSEFYADGRLRRSVGMKGGVAEGMTIYYSEDGIIEKAKVYRSGKLIGEGLVSGGGKLEGDWKEFYETGELRAEGRYRNNRRAGSWKFYFRSGAKEQDGVYDERGQPIGRWEWRYENGILQREESYENGKLEGLYREYSPEGSLVVLGSYLEGKEDGRWIVSYEDYREEGEYQDGRREGVWRHYYGNGKLRYEGSYIDGIANGKHIYFWDNGNIKEEGVYAMGVRQGEWRKYNEDGSIFMTTLYKNGIEKRFDGIRIKPEFRE